MAAKAEKKALTRGERVISFIETYCLTPEGESIGQPVRLNRFQKRFILAVYDNPAITDTAILTMARKNGKTALIAFIVLAHLVGPEAVQNSRIVSGAMSREQAAEVYNLASKCVMLSPKLSPRVRVIPSSKRLIGLTMNVEYQAVSADAQTAHGKSPILAILDEVGQIRGPISDFVSAIETAQGAYTNPLIIYISTQAANDADFFSILIDDAERNKPPKTVCHVYAADPEADLLDESAWAAANPALGTFRSMGDMKKQAEKAKRMPSFENTFRNLNLNQRVTSLATFVGRDSWKRCGGSTAHIQPHMCELLYGGLDLSARLDLTAFVLLGLLNNQWITFCRFWTPEQGIHDRAKRDRAPYDLWARQGFLNTTPGTSIDYEYVATDIAEFVADLDNLQAIAFDRYRMDVLVKEMDRIGIELPLVAWGQGYKDMAPSLDALENMILNETLRHGDHPVLTMCAANAVVTKSPAGDRKLDKAKASGRIDGMQSLAMAAGIAERHSNDDGKLEDFLNAPLIL